VLCLFICVTEALTVECLKNFKCHKQFRLYSRLFTGLWILGRHSPLSLRNKTLIHKVVLRPVWPYGIELWGCASTSNIEILQRYKSKTLRLITQAPWYVTNRILHRDLDIAPVREIFKDKVKAHRKTLLAHPNPFMGPQTTPPPIRRLRRKWIFDEIN
jgi:hypothetical protein